MTTYQKLKAENLRLKQELDIVCNEPDNYRAKLIICRYKIQRSIETNVMSGSVPDYSGNPVAFHGFIPQTKIGLKL